MAGRITIMGDERREKKDDTTRKIGEEGRLKREKMG